MAGSFRISESIVYMSFVFVTIHIFEARALIMPCNLVVKLDTMILAFPVPPSSLVAASSFMIIATRGCGVHFEGSSVHFWEWCRSSRSGLMIFQHKLIVLFSNQEHRYQLVVFTKTPLSILLLQEHV
ncbi:hypothetical protein ACFX13_048132 [Malus domestica]